MAQQQWNLPLGVTEISREVFSLHMVIFWICLAIAIVVFGVMFWSLIRYRKSKGARAANFHESTLVEILWTAIPVVILIVMAIPATATLKKIYDPSAADLDILITGYQWRWRYEYMDSGVSYFSNLATPETEIRNQDDKNPHYLLQVDEPLVVPVGKKIRFLLTSADVIHAWWVPELAVKKDAVPGFINESWARIDEPGIYRGQCAELCGKNHGFMPIEVRAVPQEAYQRWLQGKQQQQQQELASSNKAWTAEQLMERGASVYTTYCVACHQAGGGGIPPAFPALAGSPVATLAEQLDNHIDTVLYGKAGTAMSAFGDVLSAADLAAVITYERNAWGNDTGDLIQPADIRQRLEGEGVSTGQQAGNQSEETRHDG
ncbi:cytochrome c oxidase subunit II [Bacterioplanoides pacificum]|uniref:Cytochrome c oxidase subunit 2 n=1 Tax=Bacterioplanoides pacificum TaxID=1171596 RepID=A0ABV7VSB3_9GAMM